MGASDITEVALSDRLRCFYNSGGMYIVVLPSHACYTIPLSPPLSHKAEKSLAFQIEGDVPLDAESISVFVLPHRQLALVVDAASIARTLSSDGRLSCMTCLAVIPEVVLACEHLRTSVAGDRPVVFCTAAATDIVTIENGHLKSWEWAAALGSLSAYQDPYVVKLDRAASGANTLDATASNPAENWSEEPWLRSAVEEILNGTRRPSVNFETGPLDFVDPLAPARNVQQYFVAAAIVLLLACMGAFSWRAAGYRAEANRLSQEQETVYRRLFPKQPIPVGMKSRVESEFRRLAATRDMSQVPTLGDTLPVMHAFWRSLPADSTIKFNFSMLNFTPDGLESAEGMAKGYSELEVLRTELTSKGFSVPPISSTMTATGTTLRWEKINWSPPAGKVNQ